MARIPLSSLRVRLVLLVVLALLPAVAAILYDTAEDRRIETARAAGVGVPTAVLDAQVNRGLVRHLGVLALVAVLVLGGSWTGSEALVLRPVRRLLGATRRLAAGDLGARTGLPHGEGELGQLASAFDELAAALERREAETRRAEEATAALVGVSREVAATLDPAQVADRVGATMRALLGVLRASLLRLDPGAGDLICVASAAAADDGWWIGRRFPAGAGIAGRAIARGGAVSTPDILAEPDLALPDWLPGRLRAERMGSVIAAPLRVRGKLLGVATLGDVAGRVFTDDERRLLAAFADQAAIAMDNARLFAESERRRKAAESLAEVGRLISQSLEPEEVAQRIADSVLALLSPQHAGLYRVEPDSIDLVLLALAGDAGPAIVPGLVMPRGTGVVGLAVRERRPVVTSDLLADPRITLAPENRARIEQAPYRAVVAIPLLVHDRVAGVFSIGDRAGREFSEDEIALLRAFADQAAVALDNARLYQGADRQRREADVVAELARTINASLDLDTVLQRVVEGARELCEGDAAAIALRDAGSEGVVVRQRVGTRYQGYEAFRIEPGKGLGGQALLTGRPVRSRSYADDARADPGYLAVVREEGVVATLVVPIRIGEGVEGLLYAGRRSRCAFTDRDEGVLLRLAHHAAVAIQNARLFEQVRADRERLQSLSRRLVEIQEGERQHIARELHDEIGQVLTGLKLTLEMSARAPADAARSSLDEAHALVSDLIARVRELSLNLRPAMLDDLGLLPALLWHVERYTAQTGIRVAFGHEGLEGRLPPDVETAAYRIVQEALTNVARHAGVRTAAVRLWAHQDALGVQVEDSGTGFEPATVLAERASSGLCGMRERAELLGGRLIVESAPGAGTRLWAHLPLGGWLERRGTERPP
ncbi:MAG: GAF domain-containing protein [Candidatus Rokubacteria bacterium]|nr:GAF domain-containing protein [Candidatus Rokubacteria bacterium]